MKEDKTQYDPRAPEKKVWSEEKIIEVLSKQSRTDMEVEKKLSDLGETYSCLCIAKPEKLSELRVSILRVLAKKKKLQGLVVSLSLSGKQVIKQLSENGIDKKNIRIIDASVEQSEKSDEQTVYINDQSDLTALFGEINSSLEKIGTQGRFVLIDSLNTFLVYNDKKTAEKFFHSIVSKSSSSKIKLLIIAVQSKDSESLIKTVGNFCDSILLL